MRMAQEGQGSLLVGIQVGRRQEEEQREEEGGLDNIVEFNITCKAADKACEGDHSSAEDFELDYFRARTTERK